MKSKQTTVAEKEAATSPFGLFDRDNRIWMLAGTVVMILGFVLMSGGRSEDPKVFNPSEVYSTTRITIAPIVILIGLVVLIFGIFRQPKTR